MGRTISRHEGLDCIRKVALQARESQPGSRIPPRSLHQLLPSLPSTMGCGLLAVTNPSLPKLFLVTVLITALENKLGLTAKLLATEPSLDPRGGLIRK